MSKSNWRFIVTGILIILACIAFFNTFRLWTMNDQAKIELDDKDPGALLALQQKAIRLGLDLQGGIHVVLRVKMEELDEASREDAVERAMQVIRNRVDGLGVAEPVIQKQGNDRIIVDLPGYTDTERAEDLIGQTALLEFKLLESMDNAQLLLTRVDSIIATYEKVQSGDTGSVASDALEDSTTVLADAQTDSTAQSKDDIIANLFGGDSASTTGDSADEFAFDESDLGSVADDRPLTSRIELALYHDRTATNWPGFFVDKNDKARIDRWLHLPQVQNVIPKDVEFAWSTRSDIRNNREIYSLYLLKRKVHFVGKYLQNIRLSTGQYGEYNVGFSLSGEGASRFAQLTGANIGKPLAITLDDKVESAPFINSKIRKDGIIEMGGNTTIQESRNLEIVLKAGSLPAPVEIIEKNVVGATLGADSIRKGFYSSVVGLILVLLFIAVYYRLSGVIADVGLLVNLFFLLAVMAGLGATLTMPGIAGIILTIGISVDANILIFERIREELRTGKTVRAAIDAGYDRAFVAIFDSHVTTLITAGALFLLGSGPIKGFAVTLFWGVSISLYTAYVVTKQIFDIRKGYRTLSI